MVKFLFSVHTITQAKQSNRQRGARAVDLPARSFDLACPGVAPPLAVTESKNCCKINTWLLWTTLGSHMALSVVELLMTLSYQHKSCSLLFILPTPCKFAATSIILPI